MRRGIIKYIVTLQLTSSAIGSVESHPDSYLPRYRKMNLLFQRRKKCEKGSEELLESPSSTKRSCMERKRENDDAESHTQSPKRATIEHSLEEGSQERYNAKDRSDRKIIDDSEGIKARRKITMIQLDETLDEKNGQENEEERSYLDQALGEKYLGKFLEISRDRTFSKALLDTAQYFFRDDGEMSQATEVLTATILLRYHASYEKSDSLKEMFDIFLREMIAWMLSMDYERLSSVAAHLADLIIEVRDWREKVMGAVRELRKDRRLVLGNIVSALGWVLSSEESHDLDGYQEENSCKKREQSITLPLTLDIPSPDTVKTLVSVSDHQRLLSCTLQRIDQHSNDVLILRTESSACLMYSQEKSKQIILWNFLIHILRGLKFKSLFLKASTCDYHFRIGSRPEDDGLIIPSSIPENIIEFLQFAEFFSKVLEPKR